MKKVTTDPALKAIGPYSQAVIIPSNSQLVFVSGQLPVDTKSGTLIEGNIQILTSQVIDNIEEILLAAGSSLKNVIRTDVFLTDLKEFSKMNEIYSKRFTGAVLPVRQTVQVAALPIGSPIEISCIAYI